MDTKVAKVYAQGLIAHGKRVIAGLDRDAFMRSSVTEAVTIPEEIKAVQLAIIEGETQDFLSRVVAETPSLEAAEATVTAESVAVSDPAVEVSE